MKKYAILTSVLALAACGGGSGGGSVPNIVRPSKSDDLIATSNAKITNMVSNSEAQVVQYVKNKLGDDAELVGFDSDARVATHRGAFAPSAASGDLDYDKAKEIMELAQWLGDDTTSHDDIVSLFNKSKSDQDKIKSALKLLDDMYCFVGGSADETANRILEYRAANKFDKPLADVKQHSEILTLDGVDLYVAPWTDTLTRLKFNVDKNGRIESVEYPDAEKILEKKPDADITVGPIMRDGDTAFFIENAVLTKEEMTDDDADGNMVSPEYVKGDVTLKIKTEYVSYAKNLGLKYSDFGILRTDFSKATFNSDALTPQGQKQMREFLDAWGVGIEPFAGGYANKKVDDARMRDLAQNGEITFTGLAVADVRYHDDTAYNGNGIDVPLTTQPMRDDSATLVFDQTGTQTLTADFSKDWYKIQAIKDANGLNSFVIVGGNGGKDERFHLDNDKLAHGVRDSADTDPHDMNNPLYDGHNDMMFKTGYYGDNQNPDEAVALVNYSYTPNDMIKIEEPNGEIRYEPDPDGTVLVTLGFGGKK